MGNIPLWHHQALEGDVSSGKLWQNIQCWFYLGTSSSWANLAQALTPAEEDSGVCGLKPGFAQHWWCVGGCHQQLSVPILEPSLLFPCFPAWLGQPGTGTALRVSCAGKRPCRVAVGWAMGLMEMGECSSSGAWPFLPPLPGTVSDYSFSCRVWCQWRGATPDPQLSPKCQAQKWPEKITATASSARTLQRT